MSSYPEKEDAKILLSSYEGNENINELLAFFTLTKKLNLSSLKEIYPLHIFEKYFEILKSINLINDEDNTEIIQGTLSEIFSINTDWLRYFVTLAEIKNMNSAVNNLHLSKAALSKSISGIEKTLQIILFERNKNFHELTYSGKIVYEKSKEILKSLLEINTYYIETEPKKSIGEIKLTLFYTWSKDVIFQSIKNFMTKYPDVYFKTNFIQMNKIEKLVSEGVIDIGFITYEPLSENVEIAGIIDIEYVIVSSPQPKKNWDEFSYIINRKRIDRFSQSNILNSWPEEDYKRKIIMECNDINITVEFCQSGFGAAYLPILFVKKELEKGTLAIVADPPFNIVNKLYIIYRKGMFFTSILNEFIKELKRNLIKEEFYNERT